MYRLSFFEWVAVCCELMNWPKAKGEEMMPSVDPCWYTAYDDGLSPVDAVREYTTQTQRELADILEEAND